ncbi:MAG: N-acetyltransferase family protein [Vicinamibacterales bacterium]
MTIRPYHPADWTAVRGIHDLCKPDEMRGSVDLAAIVPLEADAATLVLFARSAIVVAEDGGHVVGFAGTIGSYISWVCVHPGQRRRGVATRLLDHVLEQVPPPATLNVSKNNEPARRLYERMGFVLDSDFVGKFNGHDVAVLKLRRP